MLKNFFILLTTFELLFIFNINAYAKNFTHYYNLGKIYYKKGDLIKSAYNFKKAIKLNPEFAPAYFQMGIVEYKRRWSGKYNYYFNESQWYIKIATYLQLSRIEKELSRINKKNHN